jgi:hypothetical protein
MWFHCHSMVRVRVLLTASVFTALLLGGGCTDADSSSPSEAADWAGFTERDGLQITASEDVSRLDAAVSFTLEGSAVDIDAALDDAEFQTEFAPGLEQVQQSLFDGEVDDLVEVESAQDEWRPDGTTIHRHVVIGARGDDVVLQVVAFTT